MNQIRTTLPAAESLSPFEYLFSLEKFGIKFGLENIRTLCAALGQPQQAFHSILIAGTNGKGSVTAMVDRGLRAAGYQVGRYTSPHLIRLEERFAIGGRPVETAVLVDTIDQIRRTIDDLLAKGALEAPPTFFEVTTAAALEIFRRAAVEFAVLEVGLGGRLDATNCVEPVAAAITSIAFDHEQYLGHTLGDIAAEKAGIVRPGIPVVIGPLAEDARAVVMEICAAAGARLIDTSAQVEDARQSAGEGAAVRINTPVRDYGRLSLGLRGAHQVANALVAVRLLEELSPLAQIREGDIKAALQDVQWPGRLQFIEGSGGRRLLLDAAHNPAGVSVLTEYLLREQLAPVPMVFGAMRDKNAEQMLRTLAPAVSVLVITEPRNTRARPAPELADLARALLPGARIEVQPDPLEALNRAWTHAPLVCAAGSIFLIGDLLGHLQGLEAAP